MEDEYYVTKTRITQKLMNKSNRKWYQCRWRGISGGISLTIVTNFTCEAKERKKGETMGKNRELKNHWPIGILTM